MLVAKATPPNESLDIDAVKRFSTVMAYTLKSLMTAHRDSDVGTTTSSNSSAIGFEDSEVVEATLPEEPLSDNPSSANVVGMALAMHGGNYGRGGPSLVGAGLLKIVL